MDNKEKGNSISKKESNVIHINHGQRQVTKELKKHLKANLESKGDGLPYGDWIRKMNEQHLIREAGNTFKKFKLQGMENEQAHVFTKDQVKSEGIRYMALEIVKMASLFRSNHLQIEHIHALEQMAKSFAKQVDFMDRNQNNHFTHFLTDMERLQDMSEETMNTILNYKPKNEE